MTAADDAAGRAASDLKCRYAIVFTARSGSTWLNDVLTRSGLLGMPKEWFNPDSAAPTWKRAGTDDPAQYYRFLQRELSPGGVFGVELAWPHIKWLREHDAAWILDDMQHWFFLRRRDYVAQAVSLFRAMQTGVFHSVQGEAAADRPLEYHGGEIAAVVDRLLRQEFSIGRLFQERALQPVHLWYEDIVGTAPGALVEWFAGHLQVPLPGNRRRELAAIASRFTKIGDQRSAALAQRFREENPDIIAYWDRHRGRRALRRGQPL